MKAGYLLIFAILFLPLSGCKGVGIFATVAISEKIKSGNLPKGISPSAVFNLESGKGFDIISSGSKLWTRSAGTDRGKSLSWTSHSLPDGYTSIQSVARSNDFLLLALSIPKESSYEAALYIVKRSSDDRLKLNDFVKIEGAQWPAESNSYITASIWAPDPTGSTNTFYINLRTFSGKFGKSTSTLQSSSLYRYNAKTTPDDWKTGGTLLTGFVSALATEKRIVTGVAQAIDTSNPITRGEIRITARKADNSGGILRDGQGNKIDYGSTLPVGNITWMWKKKVFIMGSTGKDSSGNYHLYVNDPKAGSTWTSISTSSSRAASFIDVSHTKAGKDRILVGLDTRAGTSGYREIDISKPLKDWAISSNSVASKTNYTSSRLSDVSITAFSFPEDKGLWTGNFLYAATRSEGLWRINLSTKSPSWERE